MRASADIVEAGRRSLKEPRFFFEIAVEIRLVRLITRTIGNAVRRTNEVVLRDTLRRLVGSNMCFNEIEFGLIGGRSRAEKRNKTE